MYEATITFTGENDKSIKESRVLEHATSFSDAEGIMQELFGDLPDFDVIAIKRSKVKEIFNKREQPNDLIWQAELLDVFIEEDGGEHQIKYKTLLFAETFDKAKAYISEYIKQGYGLNLISLKLTNIVDVI